MTPGSEQSVVIDKIREIIVFDAKLLAECVDGVIASMRPEDASALRKSMREAPFMDALVRRLTCDLSVAMTLAKTMESEDIFSSSLTRIFDTDFTFGDGLIGRYASAYMTQDIETLDGDSLLSGCLAQATVRTRATRIKDAISRRMN